MASRIHINGLPFSFSNAQLRQIFVPFGAVESAQVVRDADGHSLGLGVVQMSCPEEVEHIFSAQQLFQVEGKHLDIWEPPTRIHKEMTHLAKR
jgi:RNA recognition motif-containing protein